MRLGDGAAHEREGLLTLAGALGIGADLSLPGHVPNVYAFVARSAVLAHTARVEGMPNVLIEALALGTPAVATDAPTGVREVLEGGRWDSPVPVAAALAGVLASGARACPAAREAMQRRCCVESAAPGPRPAEFAGVREADILDRPSLRAALEGCATVCRPVPNDQPCNPNHLYSIAKLAGEALALALGGRAELEAAALRLGTACGGRRRPSRGSARPGPRSGWAGPRGCPSPAVWRR